MGIFKIVGMGVLLIIIVMGVIAYFSITGSATRTAFLTLESGEVMVDRGEGWTAAADDMDLELEDKVKTGADGKATVILYESIIINLDPDTEVTIADLSKDNMKIKQDSGSTWNKFTGMAGVGEYSVETPNTVATVRGTAFGVNMESVLVGENEVEVRYRGAVKRIVQGRKAVIRDGELVDEELSDTDRSRILVKMRRSLKHIRMLREREIEKKRFLVNIAQKTHDFTDDDIKQGLEKADRGEVDLDEMENKAPVKMETIRKVRRMTEEVIRTNRMIEKVENGDFTKEDLLKARERIAERKEAVNDGAGMAEPETVKEPVREPVREIEPLRDPAPVQETAEDDSELTRR